MVLRALQTLIHLSFTLPVRDTIIIPFHTGENQSKDRVNKLAQMVEQKCKLRQSGSEVHALKYKVMLPLIII